MSIARTVLSFIAFILLAVGCGRYNVNSNYDPYIVSKILPGIRRDMARVTRVDVIAWWSEGILGQVFDDPTVPEARVVGTVRDRERLAQVDNQLGVMLGHLAPSLSSAAPTIHLRIYAGVPSHVYYCTLSVKRSRLDIRFRGGIPHYRSGRDELEQRSRHRDEPVEIFLGFDVTPQFIRTIQCAVDPRVWRVLEDAPSRGVHVSTQGVPLPSRRPLKKSPIYFMFQRQ